MKNLTLNAQQTEAVEYGCGQNKPFSSGSLLILAGAGTGKTNTLAHRTAHLILNARESGTPLKQQSVLFRCSHHTHQLEIELRRRDIPYVKHGGLKFLEASHVKNALSILRWADNPRHRISGFRVLKLLSGIG